MLLVLMLRLWLVPILGTAVVLILELFTQSRHGEGVPSMCWARWQRPLESAGHEGASNEITTAFLC